MAPSQDEVDRIVSAWRQERPDLDFAPLHVFSRLGRLTRQLEKARRFAFEQSGLELWEFDVLAALRRAGDPFELSPTKLIKQTLVSSGTMTNRIDRLAAREFVARSAHPKDRRGVVVRLTETGLEQVDQAITLLVAAEKELLSTLTGPDQKSLAELLRKLSLSFE